VLRRQDFERHSPVVKISVIVPISHPFVSMKRQTKMPYLGLEPMVKKTFLEEGILIESVVRRQSLPLGRAVLAHYFRLHNSNQSFVCRFQTVLSVMIDVRRSRRFRQRRGWREHLRRKKRGL